MTSNDLTILIVIGGVFVLLGIIAIVWGKKEENAWYGSITERVDVREFVDRSPFRPEPRSLRTGGKIAIVVGLVFLLASLVFRIWGSQLLPFLNQAF
ncbi:MAG: hypothetical protein PHU23_05770 [Dehalococcoidales bacterium]|nr:hypothetical protein [Dehalococcoidales bacterium]